VLFSFRFLFDLAEPLDVTAEPLGSPAEKHWTTVTDLCQPCALTVV